MNFAPGRALVFAAIGLPIGFILTAFATAVMGRAVEAATIFPWALGMAAAAGIVAGFARPKG